MLTDRLERFNIILGSASPRRRQLLREAGISFRTANINCDEVYPLKLRGREIAEYLAGAKADAFSGSLAENDILVTADTIVWCNNTLLGKPADYDEAFRFLRMLSGCEHEVITGISIRNPYKKDLFSVSTRVTFRELDDDEIDCYISDFKPFDKAGAYGIQERIGLTGITSISGSYYNVVGMPVGDLMERLAAFIS